MEEEQEGGGLAQLANSHVVARNPFEQLQDVVPEPRQAFEDIVTLILKCLNPNSRRVRVHRGDGGIDAFSGTLGTNGEADVYQIKYFPSPWGDSQKQQIREAYGTARNSNDYQLKKWVLCVPARLPKEDLRWLDEWRSQQERSIELLDGDDLTLHLSEDRCAAARTMLREWGVAGVEAGGLQLSACAFIRKEAPQSGLTASLYVRIENRGDKSARNIKATVIHAETRCLAEREQPDWQAAGNGQINPRILRYTGILNPGDCSVIMGILICERSTMPFSIELKLTADDAPPTTLFCCLTSEQIALGKPVEFGSESFVSATSIAEPWSEPKLAIPTSPVAKELLDMILAHPRPDERGLSEFIESSPVSALEVCFIPDTTACGGARSVKKSLLRTAVAELVQLGWLMPPESNEKVRIYELNPKAAKVG